MQLNFKKLLSMQREYLNWPCYQILKLVYRSVPPKGFLLRLFEVHSGLHSYQSFPTSFIQKRNNITGRIQFCLRNIQRDEMVKGIEKGRGKDFLSFSTDDLNESGVSVTCQRISPWAYYLVIEFTIVCHVQSFIDYLFYLHVICFFWHVTLIIPILLPMTLLSVKYVHIW